MPSALVSPPLIVAIVDDDPDVGSSLESLMRSAGMVALVFANGPDLLASGRREELACIVTDLHMPDMSGLDLQIELHRQGWPTPLIIMTAYPTDAARDQALASGAKDFLAKPVDPELLLEAIEAAARVHD